MGGRKAFKLGTRRRCFLKVGHKVPAFQSLVEVVKIQIPGFLTRYTE